MTTRRKLLIGASALPLVPLSAQASEKSHQLHIDKNQLINQLLNDYCTLLDAGKIEDCAALFSNADFCIEGVATVSGKQGVMDLFSGIILYENGTPLTKHVLTNVVVNVAADEKTAKSNSYLTVLQKVDGSALQPIFSGSYADKFAIIDGHWAFTKRTITGPLIGDMSLHLTNPPK